MQMIIGSILPQIGWDKDVQRETKRAESMILWHGFFFFSLRLIFSFFCQLLLSLCYFTFHQPMLSSTMFSTPVGPCCFCKRHRDDGLSRGSDGAWCKLNMSTVGCLPFTQQTLVQLDDSRAALGLLLDQGKALHTDPEFAARVGHAGGALELRWLSAYRRTEQESRRCRDIQHSQERWDSLTSSSFQFMLQE